MINNTEHVLGPEDILEIDILSNLPNSAGYQNNVTMIDVFSLYLFAYPTQNTYSEDNGTMHCRRHDKTCIFANTNLIR